VPASMSATSLDPGGTGKNETLLTIGMCHAAIRHPSEYRCDIARSMSATGYLVAFVPPPA